MNKKKYIKIALMFICIISITLIGTYALKLWSSTDNTELTFRIGEYQTDSMICKASEDITVSNIGPVFDYMKDGEVIPFTVLASSSNEEKLFINFNISSITDNLKEKSFKYILLSSTDKVNYNEITSGNFLNINSNDTIELISDYTINKTTYYKLIIYIDGNMENPISMQNGSITGNIEVCSKEKFNVTLNVTNGTSNNNTLKVVSGDNAIFNITASDGYVLDIESQTCEGTLSSTGIYTINNITENKECSLTLKLGNLDTSGANSPDLVDGLIPVMYDGSKWVKADSSNSNETYKWYDYDNKLWANSVLVTSTNRSTYQNATPGTTILESDILAFYVWIPRYKYKVWNINKVMGTDSYNARTTGIDVAFEFEKESTGTISCTYSYAAPSSNAGSPNETCTGNNGDYYTHPAFTFGNDELNGFWVGKFEISSSNPSSFGILDGGGWRTDLTIRILPNVTSWRSNSIYNYFTVIQNMQVDGNEYGLNTLRLNTDSHMLNNYEWGAIAYLANSKYGRCTNGSCAEVEKNAYGETSGYTTKTGCGPISGSTSYSTICNEYNTSLGQLASTTGNITGVYDMVGGANEYVMGNMSSTSGSYTFKTMSSTGFSDDWYTSSTDKYLVKYAYGTSYRDQQAYNRGRLGDATSEMVTSSSGGAFVVSTYDESWFLRGGYFNYSGNGGIFYFNYDVNANHSQATRAILVSLK